jgi:hypothetical protein
MPPLHDDAQQGCARFADQRGFVTDPVQIIVRSNVGGSAAAVLKS